jgi:alkylhydroperoxidase/carboxymuconolactone decarboxylase family protein YurZ
MGDKDNLMSDAFQVFMREAPQHAKAWMAAAKNLGNASALDKKTESLAYLAVLAALRLESGVPFHVVLAKEAGASREEVISAILVGLPAAGNVVTRVLPSAIQAYDSQKA